MRIEDRRSALQWDQAMGPGAPRRGPAPALRPDASGPELVQRIAILVFGLIQAVLVLRVLLLLLNAGTANALVAGILGLSQILVAPFEAILYTNTRSPGGSVIDLVAVVAYVGWSLLEVGAYAVLNLFRRELAYGASAR